MKLTNKIFSFFHKDKVVKEVKITKPNFEDHFKINKMILDGSDEDITILFFNYLTRIPTWFESNEFIDVLYLNQLNDQKQISAKEFGNYISSSITLRNSIKEKYQFECKWYKLWENEIPVKTHKINIDISKRNSEFKKEDLGDRFQKSGYTVSKGYQLMFLYDFVRGMSKNKKKKLKFHLFLLQRNFGIHSVRRFLFFLQGSFGVKFRFMVHYREERHQNYIINKNGEKVSNKVSIINVIERHDIVRMRKIKINSILR